MQNVMEIIVSQRIYVPSEEREEFIKFMLDEMAVVAESG